MRPFHEATKHAELMEFAAENVAKLKISRQSPTNMSLRNYIISLNGTTFTEMLLGDIFQNKSLLKYVALPQGFKMYILQRNNELCMHNILTKKYSEMAFLSLWGYS